MQAETRSSVTATVGVAAAVVGLTVAQPLATVAAPVVLAALVVEGSSTNQSGDGVSGFFHGKFEGPRDPLLVNFLTGPSGIWRALASSTDEEDTVISSGWGAANASLLASYLAATDPHGEMLTNTTWVLDNNVANPNGGFGTRYPIFAVIGVSPYPTTAPGGATIISTTYEYDINSNAPQYILNPVADLNSFAAYLARRLTQADLSLAVDADGNPVCGAQSTCQVDNPDGTKTMFTQRIDAGNPAITWVTYEENGQAITARVQKVGGVTYVGYQTDHLPLVQPLIDYGGAAGEKAAGAIEPALKAAVDYGYPDNDPLANPATTSRAALIPTPDETERFVKEFTDGIKTGVTSLTPSDIPNDKTDNVSDTATNDTTDNVSDTATNDTTDNVSDTATNDTTDNVSNTATNDTTDKVPQKNAAKSDSDGGPLRNVLRTAPKFSPADGTSTKRKQRPPKPVAISVKTALDQLSKTFAPKHAQETPPAGQHSPDAQP